MLASLMYLVLLGTLVRAQGLNSVGARGEQAGGDKASGLLVNVRECGARGDGVVNDSAAFREAARRITQAGGGTLSIPPGVYIVGEQTHEPGQYPYYRAQQIFVVEGLKDVTVEGHGATLRAAPGLRFGSFDKDTGEPFVPAAGGFYDRNYAVGAYSGMLKFLNCDQVAIRNLELDGNSGALVLGGRWGDVGRQVGATGIHLYGNRNVVVENVHTHHHGLDGIMIGQPGLKVTDPPTPHLLRRVVSEYNARQGLSWVGGRGLAAVDSLFNHTGRGAFSSAPAAGLDIEGEDAVCRDGSFVRCEFVNNVGCGVVSDAGDGGYARFEDCTLWGTTTWSVWSKKPGLLFEDCRIYGTAVHGYGSADPELATRFVRCQFEDKEYVTNGVFRSNGGLVESIGGDNILFDGCTFKANQTRSLWIDGTGSREILRNCTVLHRAVRPNRGFQSLVRGARMENVRFMESFPPEHTNAYTLEMWSIDVGTNVFVSGPACKWGSWSWGATGMISQAKSAP